MIFKVMSFLGYYIEKSNENNLLPGNKEHSGSDKTKVNPKQAEDNTQAGNDPVHDLQIEMPTESHDQKRQNIKPDYASDPQKECVATA